MSVHQRRFIDSIYYIGELTTSDKGSKVQGCVVLIATNNLMNAYIVTTKPAILINIRKLHQPALTELRRSQHQIIYQTKKMIWWTHVETTDMAARLICKSYEQEWFLSGNSSHLTNYIQLFAGSFWPLSVSQFILLLSLNFFFTKLSFLASSVI